MLGTERPYRRKDVSGAKRVRARACVFVMDGGGWWQQHPHCSSCALAERRRLQRNGAASSGERDWVFRLFVYAARASDWLTDWLLITRIELRIINKHNDVSVCQWRDPFLDHLLIYPYFYSTEWFFSVDALQLSLLLLRAGAASALLIALEALVVSVEF